MTGALVGVVTFASSFGSQCFAGTGDRHEGTYYKSQRHGMGTYIWANGDKYIGNFKRGQGLYREASPGRSRDDEDDEENLPYHTNLSTGLFKRGVLQDGGKFMIETIKAPRE
ncbi:hypothetical protein ATCC90586_003766 [Pythium insidiosum]|nr:hypothetical protein ATCC90586_003766 [Pythium insidiosum]